MYEVVTDHPLAVDSPDHLHPLGTANDNSRNPRFNDKLYRLFELRPGVLDIGCAGGGFVKDCLAAGCDAIGIEGSDYSRVRGRAEWVTIPDRLFTVDARKLFQVIRAGVPATFDVVTAWEVLEHIDAASLPSFFRNVRKHLSPGGMFIASIATFPDPPRHVTVWPRDWWMDYLDELGWRVDPELVSHFDDDWIRGNTREPERRFHIVARSCTPCHPT